MEKKKTCHWGTRGIDLELYIGKQGRNLTRPWHNTGCIFDKVFCQCYRMGWHIS